MTAKEIRKIDSDTGNSTMILMREIAAQLADLNASVGFFVGCISDFGRGDAFNIRVRPIESQITVVGNKSRAELKSIWSALLGLLRNPGKS